MDSGKLKYIPEFREAWEESQRISTLPVPAMLRAHLEIALIALAETREVLERIADEDECQCDDHTQEDCCNNVGEYCAGCLARAVLHLVADVAKEQL